MFSCRKTANIRQRLGASHSAANELLQFSHKKTLILAYFFYRKRACSECSHYVQFKNIFAAGAYLGVGWGGSIVLCFPTLF